MGNTPGNEPDSARVKSEGWGWQRRVVVGILGAIGLYYAVGFPLVTSRLSLIPLGLVFIALAVALTAWWPRSSPVRTSLREGAPGR